MNVNLFLAWRYIRSKNSHSVIRWISRLSIIVTLVVCFAMVVVLSAFNGIQGLVTSFFDTFEAPYELSLNEGGNWDQVADSLDIHFPEVSRQLVLESEGLLMYDGRQEWVTFKGVDPDYLMDTRLEESLVEEPLMRVINSQWMVPGLGIKYRLGLPSSVQVFSTVQVTVYGGKQSAYNPANALVKKGVNIGSYFSVGPEFDLKYVLCARDFLTDINPKLIQFETMELWDTLNTIGSKATLLAKLPLGVSVKDQNDKHGFVFKTHRTEKRMTFLILFLILFVSLFNAVASVVMLILDKKREIKVLRSLGMTLQDIRKIYYNLSILMGLLGVTGGLVLGCVFVLCQQLFGFIPFEGGIVPNYPVELLFQDILIILVSVSTAIGLFSAIPVRFFLKEVNS